MQPDTLLGPYRITVPLGAGGMGEVYRATDARLGRDVAIKVLPPVMSRDAERLRRFEQEARATGALNHPNILSVFDFGRHDGSPYLVSELLEGETLRERLAASRLPVRKAIDYATQLAEGLAAAHDRNIVHRDLKPENIFITKDGRVKILDFGLARVSSLLPADAGATDVPTTPAGTDPGMVLGTVGYMSPEQVRGKPADVRSDIFAFGAVLYEMLSARRAFRGNSAVETMNAILNDEPPELSTISSDIPPALATIVNHCLEKTPEQRFQSSHDIAFSLKTTSNITSSKNAVVVGTQRGARRWLPAAAIAAATAVGAVGALLVRGGLAPPKPLTYKRLTFRRAQVTDARFAPGGTVVYTMSIAGNTESYAIILPRTDARSLALAGGRVASISKSGDLAVLRGLHYAKAFASAGTLSVLPISGGTPRDIAENVQDAAWDPAGTALAVVRSQPSGMDQIEYPPGHVIYRATGRADYLRFSPDGQSIAFFDHPGVASDSGTVAIVDLTGHKRDLTENWNSTRGLAWSPKHDEIWFTAAPEGARRSLYAVTTRGKLRLIESAPSSLVLLDVDDSGRSLLSQNDERIGLAFRGAADAQERELSWFDWGVLRDVSPDGSTLLFDETGEAGGDPGLIFLRRTDGSPAVLLTHGTAATLSHDGKWVVGRTPDNHRRLMFVPTGAGDTRTLSDNVRASWGALLPDGQHLAMLALDQAGPRLYVANLDGSARRPISPAGLHNSALMLSPDGRWVGTLDTHGAPALFPIAGGDEVQLAPPGAALVSGFSADGRYAYLVDAANSPDTIERVEIATGKHEPWMTLHPTVLPSSAIVQQVRVAPDGKSYAYQFYDATSTLYIASQPD
ncbi:MAG: serine/threonine-protein kinase [Acidobacteria bacterium]|nr:serine/threonine-protein kinase [Acidobacteriota bacterium]MBV9476873.1 serine/threonine-protein kinase [Acidobacteriota bacterium]